MTPLQKLETNSGRRVRGVLTSLRPGLARLIASDVLRGIDLGLTRARFPIRAIYGGPDRGPFVMVEINTTNPDHPIDFVTYPKNGGGLLQVVAMPEGSNEDDPPVLIVEDRYRPMRTFLNYVVSTVDMDGRRTRATDQEIFDSAERELHEEAKCVLTAQSHFDIVRTGEGTEAIAGRSVSLYVDNVQHIGGINGVGNERIREVIIRDNPRIRQLLRSGVVPASTAVADMLRRCGLLPKRQRSARSMWKKRKGAQSKTQQARLLLARSSGLVRGAAHAKSAG